MATRKYISEFGLNMWCSFALILQQSELSAITDTNLSPHIYIILRRPRITIDPKSVVFTEDEVSGRFFKQIKDSRIEIPFTMQNRLGSKDITLESEYPFTEYRFLRSTHEEIGFGKCAFLLRNGGPTYWHHLDLEVLYVGQSFGVDGSRNAFDRLRSHSTLQGIYSEAIQNSPDQDIWLLLCTFEEISILSFDGSEKAYGTSDEEDDEHLKRFLQTSMSEQQKINFTEAALIRYFKPAYNQVYKNTFPNPAHSIYSECYELDLNLVGVELETKQLGCRIWSDFQEPEWIHFCHYELNSIDDRKSMFEFAKT